MNNKRCLHMHILVYVVFYLIKYYNVVLKIVSDI